MKKFFVLFLVAMATLTVAKAQVYVGGTVGFASSKADSDASTETSFKIMPEVGYNLSDKWAIGTTLGYADGSINLAGLNFGDAKLFTIAPYVRYTFFKSNLVNLFLDGGVGYSNLKVNDVKSDVLEIAIKPGLAVNLSENVSLVAKYGFLGYEKFEDASNFGLNLNGNALSFGFYYSF